MDAVTPYGRSGPSSRVRVFEWAERSSVPVRVSSYVGHHNASPSYLVRHPRDVTSAERRLRRLAAEHPERLLLHREASPLSRGSLERRLLQAAETAIYDFDDALQWDDGHGGLYRRWAPKARKALHAVHHADRIIAGNEVLADWASEHHRDVVVIPSCVDPDAYQTRSDHRLSDPPRLGWLGSRDNEVYLQLIAPALWEIHRRTGARVVLLGTTQPTLGRLEDLIDRVAWSEAVQSHIIATFDVGLFPLPDAAYERGKCGYKLLQYAAAAVPAVASPVGVNRRLISELGAAAAQSQDEWVDAVLALLECSDTVRRSTGAAARAAAEQRYSFEAWLGRWEEAVCGARPLSHRAGAGR